MVTIAQRPGSTLPVRVTSQATQTLMSASADASKAYHATGEWGKRGMTLQELTHAFDAFNEHEEKVAIGFAWSEDCSRRLEEPLSEVKTVFSDLDGLRPLRPAPLSDFPSSSLTDNSPSSSSSPSSSASTTPISSYQPSTLRRNPIMRTTDEFGYIVRPGSKLLHGNSQFGCIGGHAPGPVAAVDEDTIKTSHKRRRSLPIVSPHETPFTSDKDPECDFQRAELIDGLPARPSSRLGFFEGDLEENEAGLEQSTAFSREHLEGFQIEARVKTVHHV